MNYEFGYSMLFLEIIGFVAEFCGKVARSVYAAWEKEIAPLCRKICRKVPQNPISRLARTRF